MVYRLHKPAYPVSQFVEFLFYYEGYNAPHKMDKFLPDGSIDLLIDLTETAKKLFHDNEGSSWTTFKKSWISGMKTDYILVDASVSCMIGVHFRPGGCFPFVDFPMSELNNLTVELDTIMGNEIHSIRDAILHTKNIDLKFQILEGFLIRKGKRKMEPHPLVDYSVNQLLSLPQMWTIEKLTHKTGYTQKHLITLFKKHVGLAPKMFARISKFQKIIKLVENQQKIDWTSLAYECGYFDQAHFIKEFRAFSGLNPSSYLLQRGEYLNYLPVS